MENQRTPAELNQIASRIKNIKNTYNEHWELYADLVEGEQAPAGFDQIMDQVITLLDCYKAYIADENGENLVKAREAELNSIKAVSTLLRNIADGLKQLTKETSLPTYAPAGTIKDLFALLDTAEKKHTRGVELAEDDEYGGVLTLKDSIKEYQKFRKASQRAETELLPRRQVHLGEKSLTLVWVAIAVSIALALFRDEMRALLNWLWGLLF